ncbi:MAG: PQQ-binding-like beta-propeller repeat protein [Proteobacteria bacterium]|nr:PQQ-binding-like beta-propeller repeat protein [Pseudomonadota bacterium]
MAGSKLFNWLRLFFWGVLVVFSFGAAGEICGGALETTVVAFNTSYQANKNDEIHMVMERIGQPKRALQPSNTNGLPMAVLVTNETPRTIIAINLSDGSQLWKTSAPIRSDITLKNDLAIFQSGDEIAALDSRDGQQAWTYPIKRGWNYYGADTDGEIVVIATGTGGRRPGAFAEGTVVGVKASNGRKRWEHESGGGLLGEPAIYNETVFVPWDRQKMAVIDADKGVEICRILALDYTINYVNADSTGVFFGSLPSEAMSSMIFRFNDRLATGKREGSTVFSPNLKPIPGDPAFKRDGFTKQNLSLAASGKISLHWKPSPSQSSSIAMENNQFYLQYWRYIIAFDSATSQVLWTYKAKQDIEGLDVVQGGVVGVNAGGRLFYLSSETGAEKWSHTTGHNVLYAAFDANGFNPDGVIGTRVPPYLGLKEIVWDKDNRMLPIRSYAASLMAELQTPIITRDLLMVYSDPATPDGLRDTVAAALEKRSIGSQYLVQALDMHYDFLEQTKAAPMEVIAPALITMGERSAIPGLLGQLNDHETPIENLSLILNAIIELGDASVLDTLKNFLTRYHADSSFQDSEYALAIAAEGILKFGAVKPATEFVVAIRDDNQTLPELQFLLRKIIDPAAEEKMEANKEVGATVVATPKADVKKEKIRLSGVPQSLSSDQIKETMNLHQNQFKTCVADAMTRMPTLTNIKLRFTITGKTGRASELHVLPGNVQGLQQCMARSLKKIDFPKFKNTRQMAMYEISIK